MDKLSYNDIAQQVLKKYGDYDSLDDSGLLLLFCFINSYIEIHKLYSPISENDVNGLKISCEHFMKHCSNNLTYEIYKKITKQEKVNGISK